VSTSSNRRGSCTSRPAPAVHTGLCTLQRPQLNRADAFPRCESPDSSHLQNQDDVRPKLIRAFVLISGLLTLPAPGLEQSSPTSSAHLDMGQVKVCLGTDVVAAQLRYGIHDPRMRSLHRSDLEAGWDGDAENASAYAAVARSCCRANGVLRGA
jgi:hypothetical protein